MKCNTLPNCAAASGARYTFQRKICMNFKCSISQLRPETSERKGRRDQSLWWCVKRPSSSLSMYFSSLPFIWQPSVFHLIQNKQVECSARMPGRTCGSSSGHICKHTSQTESFGRPCMIEGYYNAFKVSPSGHFVHAETWLTHHQQFCLCCSPSHTHTHTRCSPRSLTHLHIHSAHSASDAQPCFISASLKAEINDKHKAAHL